MEFIKTDMAASAIGPYSQGVTANGFYFFSGQIALDTDGNFCNESLESEAKQVLKNIEGLLTSQGLTKENVMKATVFLADMGDFQVVNGFYAEYFGGHKPARSTVQVAKLPMDARVEIEVIAVGK